MSNLDVALRLKLERSGFREGERDLKDIKRAASELGTGAGRQLGSELQNAERRAKDARQAVEQLGTAEARLGAGEGSERLIRQLARLNRGATAVVGEMKDLRESMQALGRTRGVEDLTRDLEAATRRADDLDRKLRSIGTGAGSKRFGGGERGRDFLEEGLERSGAGAIVPFLRGPQVLAGAAVAAPIFGASKATSQAISMEAAMAEVKKQLGDVDTTPLRNGILQLSEQLGVAKEQIAALVAGASKTNVAQQDLLPFASYASKFAVAADMNQGEAGQVLGLIRSQFNLPQSRVPQVLDSVNYLADRSSSSEKDILEFLGRASPSATIANLSPENLAAFGTGFLNVGTAPEVAATGFNALVTRLGTASGTARSDKDFAKALSRVGLSGRGLQDSFYKDSSSTIVDLFERIGNLPREKQLDVLKGIGGQEYGDDFARITSQTGAIKGFLADSTSASAKGSVEAGFNVYNETASRKLEKASTALASFGVEIGQTFLPAVKMFADAVNYYAGAAAQRIRDNRTVSGVQDDVAAGRPLSEAGRDALRTRPDLAQRITEGVIGSIGRDEAPIEGAGKEVFERLPNKTRDALKGFRERYSTIQRELETAREKAASEPSLTGSPQIERLEQELMQLNLSIRDLTDSLKQDGATRPEKVSFGGAGVGRIWQASLGGGRGSGSSGGGFSGTYSGGPVMDGFGGSNGGVPPGAAPFLPGGGSVRATRNPGGAAGELYDVFQATGFNDAQSFALLGHAKQESELNPGAWNPKEGAGGILQWRDNRLSNLKRFAADRGMSWQDRSVQAAFVRHEMENDPYERKRSARFRAATTIPEASAALHDYVRFGDNSAGTRLGNAEAYAREFGAGGTPFAAKPGRGSANLMHGQFGPAGSNLTTITSSGGAKFTVHQGAAASFKGFVDELESTGYRIDPRTSAGYNYRSKRGGFGLSQHAYGNAIDINPQSNAFASKLITDLPPNVSDMAAKHGLSWGGDWKRKKDAMHFEWTGRADPAAVAAVRERIQGPADGYDDDGWAKNTKASRPVPSWGQLTSPRAGGQVGGIGSDRAASAGRPQQVTVHQHFAGTDPGLQARRSQREQGRAIRMAEARALHDTQVPIA